MPKQSALPARHALHTDDGLFTYRTSEGKILYGLRLRIKGRLWQRQGFTSKTAAKTVRDKIRVEQFEGLFFPEKYRRQQQEGLTIEACCQLVIDDYRRHHRKSQHSAKGLATFWKKEAGARSVSILTSTWLTTRADRWLKTGITTATVNRRISFLLRGIRLANIHGAGLPVPHWSNLKENPARTGFLDWPTFLRIRAALPRYVQVPVTIGFWTGMRMGEIKTLKSSQLQFDHRAKTVKLSLSPLDTKNDDPRIVIMPGDLYELLKVWRTEAPACLWVCHRNGKRLNTIDTIWESTCVKIGLATRAPDMREYRGPLLHDLRRSGVRNLIQAGVPEKVAMQISGHKTRSVFDRYHIVVETDLADAGRKVVAYCEGLSMSDSMSIPQDASARHT
jgi:integrase